MSRQDKATTEKFTRTLRDLVKRPENKVCADCKKNDPRWASWNLGVFLCIRCSGIHRGMGTHISKVKSVDLDVWTPEQMESIQKWGNHLANLYWEAHLKAGHVPPEHKMESFIRSKYESRRWALDGPPPPDPSVLERGHRSEQAASTSSSSQQQTQAPPPVSNAAAHATSHSIHSRGSINRQPQPRQLLSAGYSNHPTTPAQNPVPILAPATSQAPPVPQPPAAPENDLFSLDFHAPPSALANNTATTLPRKDVKHDILSLFSTPAAPVPASASFGQFNVPAASWGGVQTQQLPAQPTSMIGTGGAGAWGASSGWNATPVAPPAQNNIWGNPAHVATQQTNLFNTNDVWGSAAPSQPTTANQDLFGSGFSTNTLSATKKEDAFGDLWGGFK